MKRSLAILTVLIMVVSLFSGCSPDELTFLNMNQETTALESYTMTGTVNWDADLMAIAEKAAIGSDDRETALEFAQIVEKENLKHLSFTYGIDMKNQSMAMSYSAGKNQLVDVRLLNETCYVNFDGMLDLIKRNDSDAIQDKDFYKLLETARGKYVSVSASDFDTTGMSSNPALASLSFQENYMKQLDFQKKIQGYFMDFVKTELKDYSPNLVKKTYNSTLGADVYGYSVKSDDAPLLALDFIKVLLNHIDGLEAMVTKIVSDPSFAEQAGTDVAMAQDSVKTAFADLRKNLETTRTQVDEAIKTEKSTQLYSTMLKSSIGSLTMDCGVAKLGSSKYWNRVSLKMTESPASVPLKGAYIDITVTVDASTPPSIQKPASVIPFSQFNETLPHTLVIEPDYDSATYTAGLMGSKYMDTAMVNVNGFWFISIDSLPSHFRSMVKSENGTLSIGGHSLTSPTELHTVGGTYIAVSAFRNAGVTLTWDGQARTITLKH